MFSHGEVSMSRAVNINEQVDAVETLCVKHAIAISTIEPLASGGTRVVLLNLVGADRIRELCKNKLITSSVVRSPLHMARHPQPPSR